MNGPLLSFLLAAIILLARQSAAPAQTTNTAPANPFAAGTLVNLNSKSGELHLKTPDGDRAYFLTPTTYIFRGEEKLTADKLKPGDLLKLRITTNPTGKVSVVRIKVDTNTVALPPLTPP